jgi:hypothetical protein
MDANQQTLRADQRVIEPDRDAAMGELILHLIFYAFAGLGFAIGKRLLPRISGGRLVMLPLKEPVGPIWSWKRMPNGQIGVEPTFFSMIFGTLVWGIAVALFIWFLVWWNPR